MEIERVIPPPDAAEREMLTAWLDLHRATLAGKCAGLSDDQLREQAVPPSTLSMMTRGCVPSGRRRRQVAPSDR